MPKLLVNKFKLDEKALTVNTRQVDRREITERIEKTIKNDINELVSKYPIVPGTEESAKTPAQLITDLNISLEEALEVMSKEEKEALFNRVNLEVELTEEETKKYVKNKALFIDTNEICMITSKTGVATDQYGSRVKMPILNSDIDSEILEIQSFTLS